MKFFDEYANKYDFKDPDIYYKYYHSYRVMDNMILLAKNMNLPKKDIELAACIGLLHDIGRFEQQTNYKSFSDFNIDHGDYGCEVIKKNNALSYFDIDTSDYDIVITAIRNHNKFKIEPNLSNRALMFSKMIRDADKLDIFYALGNKKIRGIIRADGSDISKEISDSFFKEKMIRREAHETVNDCFITMLGFIYDINFNITLDIIRTNKYFDKIYSRLKNKDIFKPYFTKINDYINERID